MFPGLGCLAGFPCPLTTHRTRDSLQPPRPPHAPLRITSQHQAEDVPKRSRRRSRTQWGSTPAGCSSMPMVRVEAVGKPGRATAQRPRRASTAQTNPIPLTPLPPWQRHAKRLKGQDHEAPPCRGPAGPRRERRSRLRAPRRCPPPPPAACGPQRGR
jgi:hypothetical protein